MNFGFITTSRADFGYYLPLLEIIKNSQEHNYFIFAGGMHTCEKFGNSYKLIEKQGYKLTETLETLVPEDDEQGVSKSMGLTTIKYAEIWNKYKSNLDVIFALGDRFEMLAAVSSVIPFNIPIAHLHGGETTLGAIDNKFRHAISSMSDFHFTSNKIHADRVSSIIDSKKNVYNVGATVIDSIINMPLFNHDEFMDNFGFDIQQDYILTTFHPETVSLGNKEKINSVLEALKQISETVLCTLPNADTQGTLVREALLDYEKECPDKIKCYENLGQKGYLTAMKNCSFMLGNTSSGIIEACSFNIPVLNIGDRQKGRLAGKNVVHTTYKIDDIINGASIARKKKGIKFINPYGTGVTAKKVIKILNKKKIN